MNTDRDMYYGNYGYASSMPFPNQMMGFPNQGMFPNINPYNTMMPCTQNNNTNNSYPPNNMTTTTLNNDLDGRFNIIERQIRRLNDRITRLEAAYNNNNQNMYTEPDNSMYMM